MAEETFEPFGPLQGVKVLNLSQAIAEPFACAMLGDLGITLAWQSGANEAVFYAGMAIFGFGYAGLTVIAPMLTRGTFGPRNYSQIYSWVSTGIFIATAISFTVYGLIYDNTGSYDGCFMVVIALYVVAAVLIPFTLKAGDKLWKK